jgi:DegV family protein with EDD domain
VTVAVVTDSAASVPPDVATKAGVTVVPMWLTIGGRSVHDGELSLEEVIADLDQGLTTSGPTPGEIAQAIESADTGQGTVVLSIAQAMSGTFGAAKLASEYVESEVRVVDTRTAAGAQGLVVLAAARCAAAGGSLDDVVAAADRTADRVRLLATLPSLDQLAKGGRVPGAAAWAGRWLGVNPLFGFKGGHVRPLRPALSRAAAVERIVTSWADTIVPGAPLNVAVMHALDPEQAESILASVRQRVEPASYFVGSFSPVMVAHTGPGLVGLAWWWDDEAG